MTRPRIEAFAPDSYILNTRLAGLPDERRIRIQQTLDRIAEIGRQRELLSPVQLEKTREILALNLIVPDIQETAQAFMDSLREFKGEGEKWNMALVNAGNAIDEKVRADQQTFETARYAMAQGRRSLPGFFEKDFDPVRAVTWEVAAGEEDPRFAGENPYSKILDLMDLGATNVFFGEMVPEGENTREERLFLHFPLDDYRHYEVSTVACLTYSDDGPGDEEVRYTHHPRLPCHSAQPVYKRKVLT